MAACTFSHLYEAVGDSALLDAAYNKALMDLVGRPLWEGGTVLHRRILWSQGFRARTEDRTTFRLPGLYLWGIDDRPLYIGITRGSFSKRFSRYIWHPRSQCNLAKDFEAALITDDINGFPVEITEWYARCFGGSKVRLRGAVRFAKEGIASVWFALFPHNSKAEIEELERALVPVAEAWNYRRGLPPLLNVEFNRRNRNKKKVVEKEPPAPTP